LVGNNQSQRRHWVARKSGLGCAEPYDCYFMINPRNFYKVEGRWSTLKRGTVAKNIRLTSNQDEVECNVEKVRGLVLKTCFLKKAW